MGPILAKPTDKGFIEHQAKSKFLFTRNLFLKGCFEKQYTPTGVTIMLFKKCLPFVEEKFQAKSCLPITLKISTWCFLFF
jgi:hypothetical protein